MFYYKTIIAENYRILFQTKSKGKLQQQLLNYNFTIIYSIKKINQICFHFSRFLSFPFDLNNFHFIIDFITTQLIEYVRIFFKLVGLGNI